MSKPQVVINDRAQTFESLRAGLQLSGNANRKFIALNSHIANTVVLPGELVIFGDEATPSSTSAEAYWMTKAMDVHIALLTNNVGLDDFFLDNFELLKNLLLGGGIGAGVISDGWSRHLEAMRQSLLDIEKLHLEYVRTGTPEARSKFFAERAVLFKKLNSQLDSFASYGSGLKKHSTLKRMLGISLNQVMTHGEIEDYASKVNGVAKAAKYVKKGVYIGTAFSVASSALDIQKACMLGREDQCTKAKYVSGASLVGGLAGSAAGGAIGGAMGSAACYLALGIATGGPGALACVVIGGAIGGVAGGKRGESYGEQFGDFLYGNSVND
jgi:hypothetical protein